MVPNFALSLSFEGISLLRRVDAGWASIDGVALSETDLDAAMARLRDRAVSLDPKGDKVLLVLPNEQIRYLDKPDFGGDKPAQAAAARTVLDGATPYSVDELAIDHVTQDGRLYVAAVARETLEEAENFAITHGFQPVGFTANPAAGAFVGPMWFGAANSWGKRKATPPSDPFRIVEADEAAFRPVETAAPEEGEPEQAVPQAPALQEPAASAPPTETENTLAAAETDLIDEPSPDVSAAAPVSPEPVLPDAISDRTNPDAALDEPRDAPLAGGDRPSPDTTSGGQAAPEDASVTETLPAAHAALQASAAQSRQADVPTPAFSSQRTETRTVPANRKLVANRDASAGSGPIKPRFTPVPPPPAMLLRDARITNGAIESDPSDDPATSQKTSAAGLASRFLSRRGAETAAKSDDRSGDAPQAKTRIAPKLSGKDKTMPPAPALPAAPKPPKAKAAAASAQPAPPKQAGLKRPKLLGEKAMPPLAKAVAPAPSPAADSAKTDQTPPPATTGAKTIGRLASLKPKNKPAPSPETPEPPKAALSTETERERMTVFGARNQEKVGGKPRFLGLMLTIGLLLVLIGVAAWASVFLDNGLARLFRSHPAETTLASLPETDATTAALSQPEKPATAPESAPVLPDPQAASPEELDDIEPEQKQQVAALDPAPAPVETDAPALSRPQIPARALTPEEAAATYAATGIWQRSPTEPRLPGPDGVKDIYVASIDPLVQQFDAVALPTEPSVTPEPAMANPGLPPPAGMTFDFDRRGLVVATPEGALSPDGLRIYTGRPPVVPPLREAALRPRTPQTEDAAPATPQTVEPFSGFRPEARPDDLLEQRERVKLKGVSMQELARFRPVLRPRTAQEDAQAAEPDSPATDQAVIRSLVPVTRPRNMQAIVRRAERQRPTQTIQAAAVAPRTVQPTAPSSANVARSATVRNAINLSRVSLIGVYGTPSKRRALVRLPNGSYKKVKSGDRLDGGKVTGIGESDLRYSKSGRTVTLKMPRG